MKSPTRTYILSDEQVEVILDRLSKFHADPDVALVGGELARQQQYDPNHSDTFSNKT